MEFYVEFKSFESVVDCFNSQRDGILPQIARLRRISLAVSTPNGMEFYLNRLRLC